MSTENQNSKVVSLLDYLLRDPGSDLRRDEIAKLYSPGPLVEFTGLKQLVLETPGEFKRLAAEILDID